MLQAFGRRSGTRSILAILLGSLVVGALAWSIFSSPGPFYFDDSVNHFYLVEKYHDDGSLLHYTINSPDSGSFYPTYAMYGGTLYALTALLGSGVHSDWFAYGLTYFLAVCAAFAAVLWLARMAVLPTHQAAAVALVYVTSSYYLSNAYGRGAWTEFIATSAFPLVLAAFVDVARSVNSSRRSIALLIVATALWSGSHLITLVYGTLFAIAFGAILAISHHRVRPRLRGVALATAGIATGLALNAWFLVPQLFYARSTKISSEISTIIFTRLTHLPTLLSPFPAVSRISTTPHLYTNLPTLPLLWAVSILFVSRARLSTERLVQLVVALLLVSILLMCWHGAWVAVPRFLYVIQFPYRLLTYATLLICGLTALALRALGSLDNRAKRRWMLAGLAIIVYQVGSAAFQIQQSRDTLPRGAAEVEQMNRQGMPPEFNSAFDYRFIPERPITGANSSTYATALRPDGTASVTGVPPGTRVVLDIPASPFVKVKGATRAGATHDGLLVIDTPSSPADITVTTAVPLPAKIGQWLTGVGALFAILLIAMAGGTRSNE